MTNNNNNNNGKKEAIERELAESEGRLKSNIRRALELGATRLSFSEAMLKRANRDIDTGVLTIPEAMEGYKFAMETFDKVVSENEKWK